MAVIQLNFPRRPESALSKENPGYEATIDDPTRILVDYSPPSTGVRTTYEVHQALLLHYCGVLYVDGTSSKGSVAKLLASYVEATRGDLRSKDKWPQSYLAWPWMLKWMYTWRTSNRSHMNRFDPLVGKSIMPLLNLAELMDMPELISDLISYVQNKEESRNGLDECLSSEQISDFARGRSRPVEFQDLCDHWRCHRLSRNGGEESHCQKADRYGTCRESNHGYGIDVFDLEHWTSGCASQGNDRGKKRRRELRDDLKAKGMVRSLAEWVEAEKYEPALVEVTCKHFFGP